MKGFLRLSVPVFLAGVIFVGLLSGCATRPVVNLFTVLEILSGNEAGFLAWFRPRVVRVASPFASEGKTISADVYRVPDEADRPGLLVIHGLAETGKDDPQLVHFAGTMARAGFVVLVPDFPELKSFRVRETSVKTASNAFDHLLLQVSGVRKKDSGILGISFGGGIGLLAAGEPEIRERVSYVISFGAYYNLTNVVRYYTTGRYAHAGEEKEGNPAPWAKWYLILKNLDFLDKSDDRAVFDTLCRKKFRNELADVTGLVKSLSPEGRTIYELLDNAEFSRFPTLYQKIPVRMRNLLEDLSLTGRVDSIQADLILSHGVPDPLIPHTETLRLADALKGRQNLSVTLLRLFRHVDPVKGEEKESLGILETAEEGWKLYRLVDSIRAKAGF